MADFKTVKDIDLRGKTVLVRVDFNVLDKEGKITEDYRLSQTIPTLEYLQDQDCKIILISHAGRPEGKPDPKLSLKAVAERLSQLMERPIKFAPDLLGNEAQLAVENLQPKEILLLENLRFYSEEEANDSQFAEKLAQYAEVFVQDGFGVVHRAHASTDAIAEFLPSVAGLLLEKEMTVITVAMENPTRPFVAIIGGAKVSDKLELLNSFMDKVDTIAIGGAMANTFLAAEGYKMGKSIYEPDSVSEARKLIERSYKEQYEGGASIVLPSDVVVSKSREKAEEVRVVDWGTFAPDIRNYPVNSKIPEKEHTVQDDEYILDIGPASAEKILGLAETAQTVIWNGTLGLAEIEPFDAASEVVEDELCRLRGKVIVGGGDTAAFVLSRWGEPGPPYFVSTGGGSALELMAGKKLPGVEALKQ